MAEEKLTTDVIYKALKQVYDPEIPVNIVDLGLIYRLAIKEGNVVEADMTLTAPMCPMAGYLQQQVVDALKAIPGVTEANVQLIWDPPWTPERLTEEGKKKLGWG